MGMEATLLVAAICAGFALISLRKRLAGRVLVRATVRLPHDMLHPYRPERHYMRGPGPKWHAKHSFDR